MTTQYLAAIRCITENGNIIEGNQPFTSDEPLTLAHIDKVRELYCGGVRAAGHQVQDSKATIFAIIPLNAADEQRRGQDNAH